MTERLFRADHSLAELLDLYERVHRGEPTPDDDTSPVVDQLRLAGIARVEGGRLAVRNRIYHQVFGPDWISAIKPAAELVDDTGRHYRLRESCSLGRAGSNDIPLPDDKVSRQHALVQLRGRDEFWLLDLNSRNGTFLNGARLEQAARLRDRDRVQIARFTLVFRQPNAPVTDPLHTIHEKTIVSGD